MNCLFQRRMQWNLKQLQRKEENILRRQLLQNQSRNHLEFEEDLKSQKLHKRAAESLKLQNIENH